MEFESVQVSASWCELESSSLDLVRAETLYLYYLILSCSLLISIYIIYIHNLILE